jgi:hypothetical protein
MRPLPMDTFKYWPLKASKIISGTGIISANSS